MANVSAYCFEPEDSLSTDSGIVLPYPFSDPAEGSITGSSAPLYLQTPSNINYSIEYDPETGKYITSQKIGEDYFRSPSYMTFDEYVDYDMNKALGDYWAQKVAAESFDRQRAMIPKISLGNEIVDRIFGGSTVDIKPQGSAELTFAIKTNKTDNPSLPERTRKTTTFDFDEKIQMSVTGSIGDKLKLTTTYNTEATFDFENRMNLEYAGQEDEIIKKIEAGNVSLPLSGSLITGSQTLFGVKTQLQFGKLMVTSVFSQEKGKKSEIDVKGGAQTSEFKVKADQYEDNKHFFLSQYFKEHYESALANLPLINSGVNITKVEVWVTSRLGQTNNTRNIVAFMDLGESNYHNNSGFVSPGPETTLPSASPFDTNFLTSSNNLYETMLGYSDIRDVYKVNTILNGTPLVYAQDYVKVESARMLSSSEYRLNNQLGFVSLNSALTNDEVLAVAFQYTYNGETYQVGEFSNGGVTSPNALITKMLKSTEINTQLPTWDLMMKNVYSIGSYNVGREGFKLDILYKDPDVGTPANYLKDGLPGIVKGVTLLRVFNLDNLNSQMDPQPDGVFDFINGVTINTSNGRVYFPVLEPFGKYLRDKMTGLIDNGVEDPNLLLAANRYVFEELYEMTKNDAQQEFPDKNRFSLVGTYQSSSSSEISLNAMNVPQGSVVVSAGGTRLTENVDYTVDYSLGRVKIINQGILNSGSPIKISFESNTLFNIQSKTLIGSRFDYRVSDDLNLGGTIMHLTERPITNKINIGDEPISNTIWGMDGDYRTEVPALTKAIDALPLINTKVPSSISVTGEFANLIPGHARAVGKDGISYIDDFEGSRSTIDLKSFSSWVLASTPEGAMGPAGNQLFPEASYSDSLVYGHNRAKFAWYVVDPLFARNNSLTPEHIKDDPVQSNHYMREVLETELFPNKQLPTGQPPNLAVFDVAYYPGERGPYNYDVDNLNPDGTFSNPEDRWGGIMRSITTNDFDAANIEFIEFWLMDPFHSDNGNTTNTGGDLYFNLGGTSEDLLKDGRKSYENGLPTSATATMVDTTSWGRVPTEGQALVDAFDNNQESRSYQDVGLDGLRDDDERTFFSTYLSNLAGAVNSTALSVATLDPSSDNYHYFRGSDFDSDEKDILERYKLYNGLEGNSPTTELSPEDYPTSSSTLPNKEDINRDNTLDEKESYYQYRVSLRPQDMEVGKNHIADITVGSGKTKDGETIDVKWYQFKIPIKNPDRVVGTIQDFKTIRFMRMFLHDFEERAVLRFAKFGLVRSEWRKLECLNGTNCLEPGEYIADDDFDETTFDVSVVNIEENGARVPINYILPPEIQQEQDVSDPNLRYLNEQSLSMKVCGLQDGHSRASYKITEFDLRAYKRLKMFVHAEDASNENLIKNGDLTVFVRLGIDFTDNYYEYEIPLELTPWGATSEEEIWPESNHFDFEFKALQEVKQTRNLAGLPKTVRYPENGHPDGKNLIYVKGNPDLSRVRMMMIGIRNPKNTSIASSDDGQEKCAEVWVNELRLSGFDESAGWAANTRVTAKLADLAIVNLSGNIRTPGFGSVDKKVGERDRETTMQYDLSSTMQLGRFLPEKSGIKVPMYVGYSEIKKNPQYNPLDPDILMKDALNGYDPQEQDSIKEIIVDHTMRKSINFTNVQKIKGKGAKKSHIYDIENIALTYAYTEDQHKDINIEFDNVTTHRGALSYNYNNRPKSIKPFSKIKSLRKYKYLRIVRDFNFYLMPSRLSFRTNMNRRYSETKPRNTTGYDLLIDTLFAKRFTWDRVYDLKYDLSKVLKFDFSATNLAIIDEPDGRIDKEWEKDALKDSIAGFGRTTNYKHNGNLSYTVPLNKFPITNWLTATGKYGANYEWLAAPLGLVDANGLSIGNTIKNTNTKNANGQANLVTLYNKVKYLKKINDKYGRRRKKKDEDNFKIVTFEKKNVKFKAGKPKSFTHELGTKDITGVEVFDEKGKKHRGKLFIVSKDKITYEMKKDMEKMKVVITAKKKRGFDLKKLAELSVRAGMGIRKLSLNYSENNGTVLPGYLPRTKLIGQDLNTGAPGLDFLFGYQPGHSFIFGDKTDVQIKQDREKWLHDLSDAGWITSSSSQYNNYTQSNTKNLSLKATVEPLPGFRIDVTANRNETHNFREVFRDTSDNGIGDHWIHESPIETGNFSISFFSLGSAFSVDDKNHVSETFTEFSDKREEVSKELAEEYVKRNPLISDPSQLTGFGSTSQEVLIPAFISAYGGISSSDLLFDPFMKMPMPNWRVTFDGLSKLDIVKKYFKKVTIGHGYRSTFSVSSFTTNLNYEGRVGDNGKGFTEIIDANGNYMAQYEIGQVSISEQLSPLIKVDMTWKNSMLTRFEIKKTRNITMSFSNNQLTEVRGNELVIGAGYRFKEVELPFKVGKKRAPLKSDLNLKADFSMRSNTTIIRKLVEGTNTPLKGQRITSIDITADYVINQRFNIQAFYRRSGNKPFVSNLFNTSNSSAGVTIRFTLAT